MRRWDVVAAIINGKEMKTFAEIGVCKGETCYPVSQQCPSLEKYYLIDPKFAPQFSEHPLYGKVPIFEIMEMTSEEAAKLIPDGSLCGCFIDALHKKPYIGQDVRLWTPKVRPGGVLCGHDYEGRRFPDVKTAVDGYYGEENVATVSVKMCKIWIYQKPDK